MIAAPILNKEIWSYITPLCAAGTFCPGQLW